MCSTKPDQYYATADEVNAATEPLLKYCFLNTVSLVVFNAAPTSMAMEDGSLLGDDSAMAGLCTFSLITCLFALAFGPQLCATVSGFAVRLSANKKKTGIQIRPNWEGHCPCAQENIKTRRRPPCVVVWGSLMATGGRIGIRNIYVIIGCFFPCLRS